MKLHFRERRKDLRISDIILKSSSYNDDNVICFLVFNYSEKIQVQNNKGEQVKFGIDFPRLGHFAFPVLHVDVNIMEIVKNPEPIIMSLP